MSDKYWSISVITPFLFEISNWDMTIWPLAGILDLFTPVESINIILASNRILWLMFTPSWPLRRPLDGVPRGFFSKIKSQTVFLLSFTIRDLQRIFPDYKVGTFLWSGVITLYGKWKIKITVDPLLYTVQLTHTCLNNCDGHHKGKIKYLHMWFLAQRIKKLWEATNPAFILLILNFRKNLRNTL